MPLGHSDSGGHPGGALNVNVFPKQVGVLVLCAREQQQFELGTPRQPEHVVGEVHTQRALLPYGGAEQAGHPALVGGAEVQMQVAAL